MGITIDELQFDPTSPTDNQRVGSFIISSSGSVIDSTDVGGTEGLNVNVLNDISIDIDGVYDVGNNANPDNVGLIGHTRAASIGDAQQVQRLSAGAPSSDNIDPANVMALDSNSYLLGWDGSAWDRISATGGLLDVNINLDSFLVADNAADSGGSLKVGSVAKDGLLTAISDDEDRADLISDLYRRIWVNSSPNVGQGYGALSVSATAGEVLATPLAGRQRLLLQNLGDKAVYIGFDGSVTTANGIKLPKNASVELPFGEDLNVYMISESGTQDVRYIELA